MIEVEDSQQSLFDGIEVHEAKKMGYSFWGFLGDVKLDSKLNRLSTPDGNAFYSWSIINSFSKARYVVNRVAPDRDMYGHKKMGSKLFSNWCESKREKAYTSLMPVGDDNYNGCVNASSWDESYLFGVWLKAGLDKCELILHEWRMTIAGRNDEESRAVAGWQPDLFLQNCLVDFCRTYDIKLVLFDLDYKLTVKDVSKIAESGVDVSIIELGTRWNDEELDFIVSSGIVAKQVEIPFDFSCMNEFKVYDADFCSTDIIYVGNRYERDWCVDKYEPHVNGKMVCFGDWLERGRDSRVKWPLIDFRSRLQQSDMREMYAHSVCSILLAKEDYCKYGFMTARLLECLFYGTVPLFIEEFGEETIRKYAGACSDMLTVKSCKDVNAAVRSLKRASARRKQIISYLRGYLSFMDADNFVKTVTGIV